MKIKFDRTAFQNETSVLTNFEKKYEVSDDTTVAELVTKFINQHLMLDEVSEEIDNWRLLAIKNMAYREMAIIEKGQTIWTNQAKDTIAVFFGSVDTVMVLAIHQKDHHPEKLSSSDQEPAPEKATNINPEWQSVVLPIRVETKARQLMAFASGFMALGSFSLLVWQYQQNKAIMTEAIIATIAFGLGFYYLLLKGRRIIFWTKTLIYRNRYNRYEKFRVAQFEHVEWMNHSEDIKFVFRYEEKGRNFITADSEKYLDLIVWAITNGIPVYTTDSDRKH